MRRGAGAFASSYERVARNLAWADDLLTVVDNHALLSRLCRHAHVCAYHAYHLHVVFKLTRLKSAHRERHACARAYLHRPISYLRHEVYNS